MIRVDACDAAGLRRAMAETAPDAVIHQLTDLGHADGAANNRLRHEGTRHLVDAARAAGVARIVAASISWAYAPGDGPADETVPLDTGAAHPRSRVVDGVRALEETAAELGTAVLLRWPAIRRRVSWGASRRTTRSARSSTSTTRRAPPSPPWTGRPAR
ncbi:NAD-dependent epimerase/dehydratase family protein [Streptomyces litchfieldiae]|uniref:NAD-dependent epimerase/dehydratase family protein n=1 Tax=Streptomyces litchfieldiae TaxID=3075543 RepID=A0ABU2MMW5_9ACTN|nr:NAD-dependent epimerase/dehydratase family protein [Streptomyces sp. DSM 44938]MDT0342952.1 NAD-dependent epimerase/dehydratase family protein [Streptomyces sp. DSM 44938]